MTKTPSDEIQFRVIRFVAENPTASQREIARHVGVSLGSVNYCMTALVAKGQVKIQNFRGSQNKLQYVYQLTPAGIARKIALTRRFLALKQAEYRALCDEIAVLQDDVDLASERSS